VRTWQKQGRLPDRPVEFLSADLKNKKDLEKLAKALGSAVGDSPSFVIMEGLTYYLDRGFLNRLFGMISQVQTSGSMLAFDFWKPGVDEHPVFRRLKEFFSERFGREEIEYNLFDIDFIQSIRNYEMIELTDIQELERIFAQTDQLSNFEEILPEYYALLKRNA